MSSNSLRSESWKSFLPEAYEWLGKVAIEAGQEFGSGSHVIVPVTASKDKDKKPQIASKHIQSETQQWLLETAAKQGWQLKAAPLKLYYNDATYLLLPVSQVKTSDAQLARQFGLDIAKHLREYKVSNLSIAQPEGLEFPAIIDGLSSGYYRAGLFKATKLKTRTPEPLPSTIHLHGDQPSKDEIEIARAMGRASLFARMLQDAPANWLDPVRFAEIGSDFAKEKGLKCSITDRAGLEKLGAGSYLSVAAGSPIEPQMICIEIEGHDTSRTTALIGKGLTFDTGGNSLKPAAGMGEMKYDMSGGAAVMAAAMFLGDIKPPTNVVCLIGAVENMPGATATRPGDIVVAMNGKSIDVLNTDAEGRLVLADLLHYARTTYNPELMVDVATLTGAVLHALGHAGAAVMTNNDDIADLVLEAGREAGEPFWQLPLWPELEKEVRSEFADIQNIAKPSVRAGTIMGGMFLKEFVGDTKWAHLDIAGTGWSCKATGFPPSGGSSFGLRTLARLCLKQG